MRYAMQMQCKCVALSRFLFLRFGLLLLLSAEVSVFPSANDGSTHTRGKEKKGEILFFYLSKKLCLEVLVVVQSSWSLFSNFKIGILNEPQNLF
jgi:hypothetical protein